MKFSIRDLLLVTVIVALAVGWHQDHRRLKTQIERGDAVRVAMEKDVGVFGRPSLPNSSAPAPNPPKP